MPPKDDPCPTMLVVAISASDAARIGTCALPDSVVFLFMANHMPSRTTVTIILAIQMTPKSVPSTVNGDASSLTDWTMMIRTSDTNTSTSPAPVVSMNLPW